jgi:hypothetical protein
MPNINVFFSNKLGGIDAQLCLYHPGGNEVRTVRILPDFEPYMSEESGQPTVQSKLHAMGKTVDFKDANPNYNDELLFWGNTYRIRAKTKMDDGQLVQLTLNRQRLA